MLERSKAIKAPNVQYHLCCTKIFQQYISEPGVIEKLIPNSEIVKLLRDAFVKQYSFQKVLVYLIYYKAYFLKAFNYLI